eukprot:c28647_g2_i1 orf=328-1488(+)
MKFGKRLQSQLDDTIPEWRDKYLSYKQLKKRLKIISAPECFTRFTEPVFCTPPHESPESGSNSVEDTDGMIRLGQAEGDQVESLNIIAEHATGDVAAAAVDSQDSSVHGAGTVTADGPKRSSAASDGTTLPEFNSITHSKHLTAEELDFIHLLNAELEKFNTFFMEKEEEYVIRLQELKDRIERVKEHSGPNREMLSESDLNEEMIQIRRDYVKFHGEMVLLENYSSLNYTGLAKILKKHDKRTGALLRMPFIQNVLHQPFFTTELLSKLVCECEANVQSLFPSSSFSDGVTTALRFHTQIEPVAGNGVPRAEIQEPSIFHGEDVENIYKSTVAALRTIKDLRKGSSTYNAFSLPPFDCNDNNEGYNEDGSATVPYYATISVCPKS